MQAWQPLSIQRCHGTVGSMRTILFVTALLLTLPARAMDWAIYENPRFGYEIEVPASFAWEDEPANGDGRSFRDGASKLAVWGGNILEGGFEDAVEAAKSYAAEDGWTLTYEATTPGWASFSGLNGNNRVLYQRMVPLCDETQYAAFQFIYSTRDMAALDPVVDGLVRTLKPITDC
jgi:hypothetical protein